MRGHDSSGSLCEVLFFRGKHNGFRHTVQVRKLNFLNVKQILIQIKMCYLFKKFTLRTCNNTTETIVFILQEEYVTARKIWQKRVHACTA